MKTHEARPPLVRRPTRSVLPNRSCETACALSRTAGWKSQPTAQLNRHVHTARQPFRRGLVAGTTRSTPTSPDCLAENIASLHRELPLVMQRTSTRATLPDSCVSSTLATNQGAEGPTSAARALPALAIIFARRLTSLSRVTGRNLRGMNGASAPP